jgi:hypothetical protein
VRSGSAQELVEAAEKALEGQVPAAALTPEQELELEKLKKEAKLRRLALDPQPEAVGDAKSSLGDAESSLGDAKSSLGDTKSSLGDGNPYHRWPCPKTFCWRCTARRSSCGRRGRKRAASPPPAPPPPLPPQTAVPSLSLGVRSLGGAKRSPGDTTSSLGDAKSSLGTLRARWVTLRARWVTLRAHWVTLRARWVTLTPYPRWQARARQPSWWWRQGQ